MDVAMAQQIGGDRCVEAGTGKWQCVDTASRDRRPRLSYRSSARRERPFDACQPQIGPGGAEPGKQAAGAAARVQHVAMDVGQGGQQTRMQGAIPPHAVLCGVHQGVFRRLHVDPRYLCTACLAVVPVARNIPSAIRDASVYACRGLRRLGSGGTSLADAVTRIVAAPRVLTDNASDTVRGIALALLAYLIWTMGDATA